MKQITQRAVWEDQESVQEPSSNVSSDKKEEEEQLVPKGSFNL